MNKEIINPDQLNTPCYFPFRKVWGIKVGYRKFEFKTEQEATNFHIKYCERSSQIPKNNKHEVKCSDKPPISMSWEKAKIKADIAMLLGR